MVRLVTVAADATDATNGVIAQDITIVPGMAPPPMPTLSQPAFAKWHAAPISPGLPPGMVMPGAPNMMAGYGVPSPTVAQPRDSGWRMDQRAIGERRAQQEHQRAYLKAQIEEKRIRDETRKQEVKEREAREDAEAATYDPFGRAGGGAPLRDVQGNLQTDLRQYKPPTPSGQGTSAPRWPPQSSQMPPGPPPQYPPQMPYHQQQMPPPPAYDDLEPLGPPPSYPPPSAGLPPHHLQRELPPNLVIDVSGPGPGRPPSSGRPPSGSGRPYSGQGRPSSSGRPLSSGRPPSSGRAGDAFARQEAIALAAARNGLLPVPGMPAPGAGADDPGESVFGLLAAIGREGPPMPAPASSLLPTGIPKPVLAVGMHNPALSKPSNAPARQSRPDPTNRRRGGGGFNEAEKPRKGPWARSAAKHPVRSASAPAPEPPSDGAVSGRRAGRRGEQPAPEAPQRIRNRPPATAGSAAGSAAGSERSGAGRPRGRGHGSYATAAVLQEQLASREDEIKSLRRQLESERATLARRTEQLLEPASPTQRDAVREESLAQLVGSHFPQQQQPVMQLPPSQQQWQQQPQMGVTNNNAFGTVVGGGGMMGGGGGMAPPQGQGQLGGAGAYGVMYGGWGAPPSGQQQPPPYNAQQQQQPPMPLGVGDAAQFGGGGGGLSDADRRDPFLSASKACVRADGPRCGRLEASKMLSLCVRFGLQVPPDMAAAAKRKGMCSYTIFIDRLRQVAASGA